MATTKKTRMMPQEALAGMHPDGGGFDVTGVIGQVRFDEHGLRSPHLAAFEIIALHDAPGEYRFPMQDGGQCMVKVEYVHNSEV